MTQSTEPLPPKNDPVAHISMLGRIWVYRPVPKSMLETDTIGWCTDPDGANPEIQIWKKLVGRTRLDTLLHELLHAAEPHKEHGYINNVAAAMTELLWEDGWRHVDEVVAQREA